MQVFKKRSRHDNIFSFATDRIVCVTKDRTAGNLVCEMKECTAIKPEPVAEIHFKECIPVCVDCKTGLSLRGIYIFCLKTKHRDAGI